MAYEEKAHHIFIDNACILRVPMPMCNKISLIGGDGNDGGCGGCGGEGGGGGVAGGGGGCGGAAVGVNIFGCGDICFENIKNCDIFVEDYSVLFYADVKLFKFCSPRQLDLKNLKSLVVKYISSEYCFEMRIPCLPPIEGGTVARAEQKSQDKSDPEKKQISDEYGDFGVELWKLKRITDNCQLQIDDKPGLLKFEANFSYGFGRKNKGKLRLGESDPSIVSRMNEPHLTSPIQRTIDREIHELKDFSREQYKVNFELQVPEGHENPANYKFRFKDCSFTEEEECILHNLTLKGLNVLSLSDTRDVDCGLISILLAICYDVRTTGGEPTCESAWTRAILSGTLSYFESFESLREVVISFLRRSLIYPIYRNYDLGVMCVRDAIDALHSGSFWILKQLIVTHQMFVCSETNRELYNRYFIEDYIRYVSNPMLCTLAHLRTMSRNLKNVMFDVFKKHLRLDLASIERDLLKEIITDVHINASTSESEDDHNEEIYEQMNEEEMEEEFEDEHTEEDGVESASGGENDDEEDDDEDEDDESSTTSSTSDTEENSVIEQCIDKVKN